jgi:hypothetical protein
MNYLNTDLYERVWILYRTIGYQVKINENLC